jgi:hypothetical protein
VGLALVVGVIGTTLGLVRSIRAESRARSEADIARAVNDFLNRDLLSAVSPDQLGNDVGMRKVIEVASRRVEGKFANQPLVEAAVRLTLGQTLRKLADFNAARDHIERSRDIRRGTLGPDDPATLEATNALGHVYGGLMDHPQAEALFREAFDGRT